MKVENMTNLGGSNPRKTKDEGNTKPSERNSLKLPPLTKNNPAWMRQVSYHDLCMSVGECAGRVSVDGVLTVSKATSEGILNL